MSKQLARGIVGLAHLVTAPLKSKRRIATEVTAAELLCRDIPVETSKGTLLFHTTTRRAYHYPWNFHDDEPDTLEWIDRMPAGSVLWDIGANIGQYTMYAALQPDVRVLAFEPAGASYAILTKNIEINRMDDRVSAYCLAFSDRTALGDFNMATTEAGSSMHAFDETVNAFERQIDVKFRQATVGLSIDDFIRLFDPPRPTHIKIDVDSIEDRIITGAAGLLRDGSVESLWVEIMGAFDTPRNARIIGLLDEVGYTTKEKQDPSHKNAEFRRT